MMQRLKRTTKTILQSNTTKKKISRFQYCIRILAHKVSRKVNSNYTTINRLAKLRIRIPLAKVVNEIRMPKLMYYMISLVQKQKSLKLLNLRTTLLHHQESKGHSIHSCHRDTTFIRIFSKLNPIHILGVIHIFLNKLIYFLFYLACYFYFQQLLPS